MRSTPTACPAVETAPLPLPFAHIAAPPAKANAAKIFLFLRLLFFDIILPFVDC